MTFLPAAAAAGVAVFVFVLVSAAPAVARDAERAEDCRFLREDPGSWATADANLDLYNGVAFAVAGGMVSFLGEPSQRWSAINGFDDEARDGLRLGSPGVRRRADLASDLTLVASLAVMPALSIAVQYGRTGDCAETWDMATDFVESFGLALFLSESVKLASGRARPFVRRCGPSAPSDATCHGDDRYRSFVSGHSILAATGAGLTCAWSIRKRAWGDSIAARSAPCAMGIALATATGGLRIAADRHWMTDVLSGFAIGSVVGWFDTWGPFDLLRFGDGERSASGRPPAFGFVLPGVVRGAPGITASMIF